MNLGNSKITIEPTVPDPAPLVCFSVVLCVAMVCGTILALRWMRLGGGR